MPKPKDRDLVYIRLDPELKRRLKKALKEARDFYLWAIKFTGPVHQAYARRAYLAAKKAYDYYIKPNVD